MWRKNTQKTNITTCVCDRRQTVEKNTNTQKTNITTCVCIDVKQWRRTQTHRASHLHRRTPVIFSGQIHNHAVWIKTLCVEKKHTEDQHHNVCVYRRQTVEKNTNTQRISSSQKNTCHILRTDSQSRCMDKNTVCGEKTHRRPTSRRVCVIDVKQWRRTQTHTAHLIFTKEHLHVSYSQDRFIITLYG